MIQNMCTVTFLSIFDTFFDSFYDILQRKSKKAPQTGALEQITVARKGTAFSGLNVVPLNMKCYFLFRMGKAAWGLICNLCLEFLRILWHSTLLSTNVCRNLYTNLVCLLDRLASEDSSAE